MSLPVSIVIPTYNRPSLLARMLSSYLAQDCEEIIVVDDASDESVEDVLRDSGLFHASSAAVRLYVVRNKSKLGQPASRMVGVNSSTQPFVFFGEDDAFLSPGHIKSLFDFMTTRGGDAVASNWYRTTEVEIRTCWQRPAASSCSLSDFIGKRDITMNTEKTICEPISVPWLHTLALIRRDLILTHGFDANYRGNAFREETDFYIRAFHHGAKLLLVPGPPAFHYKGSLNRQGGQHREATLLMFLWYEYWVARNNFYFLKKNGIALRSLGRKYNPWFETVRYTLRRILGYPGRLRFELGRRLRTNADESHKVKTFDPN